MEQSLGPPLTNTQLKPTASEIKYLRRPVEKTRQVRRRNQRVKKKLVLDLQSLMENVGKNLQYYGHMIHIGLSLIHI